MAPLGSEANRERGLFPPCSLSVFSAPQRGTTPQPYPFCGCGTGLHVVTRPKRVANRALIRARFRGGWGVDGAGGGVQ